MFNKILISLIVGLLLSGSACALSLQQALLAASAYNAEFNAARRAHEADAQKNIRDLPDYCRLSPSTPPGIRPISRTPPIPQASPGIITVLI